MKKKYLVDQEIPFSKVRVIDEQGKNLGVFELKEAIAKAKEKGLNLVLITEKADIPVCKIVDYGKFRYEKEKKEKEKKSKEKETKVIRLGYNISEHDLQTKLKLCEKFLLQGHKVKIEMILRGREKIFSNLAKEKLEKFFELLKEKIEIEKEGEIQTLPKGLLLILKRK